MSKLFIVATPIGNLGDITVRAKKVLAEVDVIACEDTRHTATLLAHLGIKKPLVSYYKHKEKEGSVYLADLVEGGKNVALVSDAGMPCISDPGSILVKEFRKRNLEYTVCPGACAFVSAIALTGVTGAFTFLGFLPEKNKDHPLTGNWIGHRECHILPDWLLIYRIEDDVLVLTLARTGSHSDLFGR